MIHKSQYFESGHKSQCLLCHSTWTQFTFSDIFFSYEYIHSQLQQIFIYIQGHNFYSTFAFFIQRFVNVQNSQIPHPFTLNDVIFFHEHIHSRSRQIFIHIQRQFFLFSTVVILIQHFVRTPLYASWDSRFLPLETRVFEDTRILNNVFLALSSAEAPAGYPHQNKIIEKIESARGRREFFYSQWTLLAYTAQGNSKRVIPGGSAPRSNPLPLETKRWPPVTISGYHKTISN